MEKNGLKGNQTLKNPMKIRPEIKKKTLAFPEVLEHLGEDSEKYTPPLPKTKYVRHVESNNWSFGMVTKRGENRNQKRMETTQNHCYCQMGIPDPIDHTNVMTAEQNLREIHKKVQPYPVGLETKYVCNVQNNILGMVTQRKNNKITCNRDKSGARNILYKGVYAVFNLPLHPNFVRRPRLNRALTQAEKLGYKFELRPVADINVLLRTIHITPPVQNDAQNEVKNDQQEEAQQITPNIVDNNAQNEAKVDQQNQQHVPENVQQNYFYIHH